jgi:hypothetical protein
MNHRDLGCSPCFAACVAAVLLAVAGGEAQPIAAANAVLPSAAPAFSLRTQDGVDWLVRPSGTPFFSFGVCCVDMGVPRGQLTPTNPAYAAWEHYGDSNQWAEATLRRLKAWGVTTAGGWSDFQSLKACPGMDLAMTPVLHMGSSAGAPWWDMWDAKVTGRMEQIARDAILGLRGDSRLLGYYSDNEMGWWNAPLFKMAFEQAPTSGQRRRLIASLHEAYKDNWTALLRDFEPEGAGDWLALEKGGLLYLRPGGNGLAVVRRFLELLAERYYSLVHDIIRKYDSRALILGDRYQSFFFPEVARASSRYLDAVSSNLNASWNDGTFPRFYLETLHALAGKPILVSEFYLAARQNRSGDGNTSGAFPVAANQSERAAGFAATLRAAASLPYVVGADWFQYYDEPSHGRYDGENYNFGLVDIQDQPYSELTATASRLDLTALKRQHPPARPEASLGVPPAPQDPLGGFTPASALRQWDRERGFVKPASEFPLADLYVCWNRKAIYLGLYAQDVVEKSFYRGGVVPECDRAQWTVSVKGCTTPVCARIGAGIEPTVNATGVRVWNLSGEELKVRNIAALELPAGLFGQAEFRAGDMIEFSSAFLAHCRGYRAEWLGRFKLAAPSS